MGEFPDAVVEAAWKRSGGRCECKRNHNWHSSFRCPQHGIEERRGRDNKFGWEAHHIESQASGDQSILSNCEILCIECHKATRTYGK